MRTALFLLVAPIFLSGCLKKDGMNIDPDAAGGVVLFAPTGNNLAATGSSYNRYYSDLGFVAAGDSASFHINLLYSGTTGAPADIEVSLALDSEALATYNAENGGSYILPPASCYRLSGLVYLLRGMQTLQVKVAIVRSAEFDFLASYALPVRIASVSAGAISSNQHTCIYSFGLRNRYDGHYSFRGYAFRVGDLAKTGVFNYDPGMDLFTLDSNSVVFGDYQRYADLSTVGIGYPVLTVTAEDSVTVNSNGGAYNLPGNTCRYDPSARTFYLYFTWGAGASSRIAMDTLTYMHDR